MLKFFNRVRFTTATDDDGDIAVGSAVDGYCTPAEAGIEDGDTVSYVAVDGDDFELGRGTYSSTGPVLSRDTVRLSKISGTAGTSKINLSGSAQVFLTAAAEDLTLGDAYNPPAVLSVGLGQSGSAVTSGSVTAPTGIEDGNYLLLKLTWDGTVSNVNLPSGFSWIVTPFSSGTAVTMGVAAKVASSESGNYSVSWTGSQEWTGEILRFDNVDTSNPIADSDTASGSAATTHTAPTVATTRRNTRVVYLWGLDDDDTPYEVSDVPGVDHPVVNRAAGTSGPGSVVYTKIQYMPGAAGTQAMTSNANEEWVAATVALNPVAIDPADGDVVVYDDLTGALRSAGDTIRTSGRSVIIGRLQDSDFVVADTHPMRGKLCIIGGGSGLGPDITEEAPLYIESYQATGAYILLASRTAEGREYNLGSWGGATPEGDAGHFSIFDHSDFVHRLVVTPTGGVHMGVDALNAPTLRITDEDTIRAELTDADWGLGLNAADNTYAQSMQFMNCAREGHSDYSFLTCISGDFDDFEFVLQGDGTALADGSWTGGGADYAEYFEWVDGNSANEDRRGCSVVLSGDKIRLATHEDAPSDIIGVVSAAPVVVGDAAWNHWSGKYIRDEFGSYVMEDYEVWSWTELYLTLERGKPVEREKQHSYAADAVPEGVTVPDDKTVTVQQRRKLNPDYDPNIPYVPREQRPEWAAVGLVGKLRVRKGQPVGDRWIKMRDVSAGVEEWLVR